LYVAPLSYLEVAHNGYQFLALIDNGSQINLIDETILPFLSYMPRPRHIAHFFGVQGRLSEIHQWIAFQISLANGVATTITTAVVDECPCSILLGQPFLIENQAVVDSANAVITTNKGPLKLLQLQQPPTPKANNVVVIPDDIAEEEQLVKAKTNLSDEQMSKLRQFLQDYRSLWRGERPGRVKHAEHGICLTSDIPIRDHPRYHSPDQNVEIHHQVNKMLEDNIIQPSKSPYSSEIVIAKKVDSDGNFTGWRFCVDFRNLNRQTIKDAYPLPRITDLLHAIQRSRYFVALDLRWGYWNIPLEKNSIKYTAFRCIKGLFEFIVMPFGLSNAPATFQRLMDFLFGDMRYDGVLAYIDDILIHGEAFEEVMSRLKIVLDRLQAEGLKVNFQKSNFFPLHLKYLGHVISDGTLHPNPAKVEALTRFKKPQTVQDVKRLLGMLGYYHRYINDFAGLMTPVFELLKTSSGTKKGNRETKVTWEDCHEAAAREVLSQLRNAVLAIPIETDEFIIETDASAMSVAAILNCRRLDGSVAPVEFMSKKLSATERRWPTRDREAYAIIVGLKKFDSYIRGRPVTINTDHKSLKWMLEAKEGRVARWASRLTEYDITICHKSGRSLEHVDYLMRFIDNSSDFDVEDHMVYQVNYVRASSTNLPSMQTILAEQRKVALPMTKGFFQKANVIYYHNSIWVPPALQKAIISACHSVAPYRHHGIKKTSRLIRRVFNWPNLHVQVVDFLSSCLTCQRTRAGLERLQGHFRTHPIPGPFQTVYMDFWSCTFNRVRYKVFTMIDQLTKWAECVVVPSGAAEVVATSFIRTWVCRFGVPDVVVTDNDRAFTGILLSNIHSSFGTKALSITPRHPEGNAVIESFHRTLNKGLSAFEHPSGTSNISFAEALDLVLYSYRSTIHLTTGDSPAFLVYGVDLRPPADNDWRFQRNITMQERLKFLNQLRLNIQFQAFDRRVRENEVRDKGRVPSEFVLGQLILIRASDYDRTKYAHYSGDHKHKLIPKWSLPNRVIHVYPNGRKALARDLLIRTERLVHIQDVRFIQPPKSSLQREEWDQVIMKDISSMFDPKVRLEMLSQFWEEVESPQLVVHDRTKRRRV